MLTVPSSRAKALAALLMQQQAQKASQPSPLPYATPDYRGMPPGNLGHPAVNPGMSPPIPTMQPPVQPYSSPLDTHGMGRGGLGASAPMGNNNTIGTSPIPMPGAPQPSGPMSPPGSLQPGASQIDANHPLPPPPYMGASISGSHTSNMVDPTATTATAAAQTSTASDTSQTDPNTGLFDSTGKTDTFGSWFNKRSSSDALTAFGAAMLKAPTFNQGLGDAALAVNNVDKQYRMPSAQDIARAKVQSQMSAYAYGLHPQKQYHQGQTMWTPQGVWQSVWSSITGQDEWQGPKGEHQPNAPEGGVPFQGTGMREAVKAAAADETSLFTRSQAAQIQLPTIDKEISLIKSGTTGVGTDAISQLKRTIVNTTGMSFLGVEPKDMNELTKMFANGLLESAQGQKGLGALSDGERALIEKANASSGSNPDAILELLQVQRQRLKRITSMQDAWSSKRSEGATTAGYRDFANNFTQEWDASHPLTWGGDTTGKGAPNTKSILDAADKIVN